MIRNRVWLLGCLIGIFVASVAVGTTSATSPQRASLAISGPRGPVECDQSFTFSATVRNANGTPVVGAVVHWSFKKSKAGDDISPEQSTTNASGVATTTIEFGCKPGKRVIKARWNDVSGKLSLRVKVKDDDDDDDDDDRYGRSGVQSVGSGSNTGSLTTGSSSKMQGTPVRAIGELPRTSTSPSTAPTLLAVLALLLGIGLLIRPDRLRRH